MYQPWHARLQSGNWQSQNGWLKESVPLAVCLSQVGWGSAALRPKPGTVAKAGSVASSQKWDASPPPTLHWPTQVMWPHLTSKGQGCAAFLCPGGGEPGIPENCIASDDTTTGLFQDSVQGHFQSPSSKHKHLFEDAERKCVLLSYILLL